MEYIHGVASRAGIYNVRKDFKPHVLLNIGFSKLKKGVAEPPRATAEGLGINAIPFIPLAGAASTPTLLWSLLSCYNGSGNCPSGGSDQVLSRERMADSGA